MARPRVHPHEFGERAVRLLREWRAARGVEKGGLRVVCQQPNLNPETLRRWYIEAETEAGRLPGPSKAERSRMAELEPDNRDPRQAK
jgi:transposase